MGFTLSISGKPYNYTDSESSKLPSSKVSFPSGKIREKLRRAARKGVDRLKKLEKEGYDLYMQENGPVLGTAGAPILERDGLLFKDLARTGELLPYEDWRLPAEERAEDLASRLSIAEIAGLMLYSPHQCIPGKPMNPIMPAPTFDGKVYDEADVAPWALSDQQKEFLKNDHVRHVLIAAVENPADAARWSNAEQTFVESLPFGIPCNNSSDPRHGAADAGAEFRTVSNVSKWPEGMGMASQFDPDTAREYGDIVSKEYRAMGITTALGPQVDLSTEPRWMRLQDTMGEHPEMVVALAAQTIDAMQTTEGAEDGWGKDSILAMAKHWPGGGPLEGGRDAHYRFGSYAVYPGGCFETQLKPFVDGALHLPGKTKQVSAMMPYYSITTAPEAHNDGKFGNAYNKFLIHDLLRCACGFDGVICTDWGITHDAGDEVDAFSSGRNFGVEGISVAERHLQIILNGCDQFGGNSEVAPVLEAYRLGCERYGEDFMDSRFRVSAKRLLLSMFRCGLFENPYIDAEETAAFVGCPENCEKGFAAQLRSLVLLKNKNATLPLAKETRVYIPKRHIGKRKNFVRFFDEAHEVDPIADWQLGESLRRVSTPEEADVCLVFAESPLSDGGYNRDDREAGGNGYLPISLQYRPYTAATARERSLEGSDPMETIKDRAYRGKTIAVANESDLDNVIAAKETGKPVVVVLTMHNPTILAELEPYADAILVEYGVERRAISAMLTGQAEPSGLLPHQLPRDMETVEAHCEDKPFDLIPYTDSEGNTYDFGFGMNWSGVISDARTEKWKK